MFFNLSLGSVTCQELSSMRRKGAVKVTGDIPACQVAGDELPSSSVKSNLVSVVFDVDQLVREVDEGTSNRANCIRDVCRHRVAAYLAYPVDILSGKPVDIYRVCRDLSTVYNELEFADLVSSAACGLLHFHVFGLQAEANCITFVHPSRCCNGVGTTPFGSCGKSSRSNYFRSRPSVPCLAYDLGFRSILAYLGLSLRPSPRSWANGAC